MSRFPTCVAVAVLSAALLAARTALTAQTASPQAQAQAQATPETQPTVAPEKETFEEKWLSFSNRAFTARWGWTMILDGLAMAQDGVNEEQVGHVPAKGEPRADRFILGPTRSPPITPPPRSSK